MNIVPVPSISKAIAGLAIAGLAITGTYYHVIRQVYRDASGNEVDCEAENAEPAEIITKDIVGKRTHWGLIAQEDKQAVDDAGVDFAGWVLSDFDDKDSQQALRYDQFISPLIKAVQELTARVKALEND